MKVANQTQLLSAPETQDVAEGVSIVKTPIRDLQRDLPSVFDDESTDGFSPAASILKTSSVIVPDISMEASR